VTAACGQHPGGAAMRATPPPRLPPKTIAATDQFRHRPAPITTNAPALVEPSALINGLPRVASYTQISNSVPVSADLGAPRHLAHADASNLCNYHALNRSHMIQAQYSPHLPYALGRYSIHATCDPSSSDALAGRRLAPDHPYARYRHPPSVRFYSGGSQVNISNASSAGGGSSSDSSQTLTGHHHQHPAGGDSLRDASMVCHYPFDDSIYIPPYNYRPASFENGGHHQAGLLQRQAGLLFSDQHQHHQSASVKPEHSVRFNDRLISYDANELDYRRFHALHQSGMTARPKSSLDSLCFMSDGHQQEQTRVAAATNDNHNHNPTNVANLDDHLYGQRISAIGATSGTNNPDSRQQIVVAANPASILKSGHPTQPPPTSVGSHTNGLVAAGAEDDHSQLVQCAKLGGSNSNQIDNSSQFITQNSIYAPSNAFHQHRGSELTVLPTSHTTLSAPDAVSGGCAVRAPSNDRGNAAPSGSTDRSESKGGGGPPRLPPKTTTTTVGKLTRVSINTSPSSLPKQRTTTTSSGQQSGNPVERAQQGPVDEEKLFARAAATTLTSC
jgi:hypothetical protein